MSNPSYERSVDNSCPHDGWYNGNPRLMIQNGTYADYRHRLEGWVEKGKMTASQLKIFDTEWAAINLDEKKKRRSQVISDTTPRPMKLRDGKMIMVSKPSDNGVPDAANNPQLRKPLRPAMPIGSIANRPDPLALEEISIKSKLSSSVASGAGMGNEIPLHVKTPSASDIPPVRLK